MNAPIEELTETAKNWNDLPVEMKAKCIGNMDFKTRTLLRSTSKGEREVVDSVKHVFDHVYLEIIAKSTEFSVLAFAKEEKVFITFSGEDEVDEYNRGIDLSTEVQKFERVLQLVKQILEQSKIGRFRIDINCEEMNNRDLQLIREMIESGPLLEISRFDFGWNPDSSIQMAVLKKCDDSLKHIEVDSFLYADFDKLQEFIFLPRVLDVDKIYMGSHPLTEETAERVEYIMLMVGWIMNQWFTNSSAIGKELSMKNIPALLMQRFEELFAQRVVHKDFDNLAIRFKTDDANNHAWLRISPRDQFLQCFIVAADSEHPDFQRMDYVRLDEPLEEFLKAIPLVWNTDYDNLVLNVKLNDSGPEDDENHDEGVL